MEANCVLYRANRLAPVALNLPNTCSALGDDLTLLISAKWDSEPITDVHFLVEADRFCRFLRALPDLPGGGGRNGGRSGDVAGKLAASQSLAGRSVIGWRPSGGAGR